MDELRKCAREGCSPVMQMRGSMQPQDHHRQYLRHKAAADFMAEHGVYMPVDEFRRDAYEAEDQGPENASDIRVSCATCGKASGWDRVDIEEFKRHGDGDYRRHVVTRDGNKAAVVERWNEMVK